MVHNKPTHPPLPPPRRRRRHLQPCRKAIIAYSRSGKWVEARDLALQWQQQAAATGVPPPPAVCNTAIIKAMGKAGRVDEALAWLDDTCTAVATTTAAAAAAVFDPAATPEMATAPAAGRQKPQGLREKRRKARGPKEEGGGEGEGESGQHPRGMKGGFSASLDKGGEIGKRARDSEGTGSAALDEGEGEGGESGKRPRGSEGESGKRPRGLDGGGASACLDQSSFLAALSACSKAGRWESALEVLKKMDGLGVTPETVAFNTALAGACMPWCRGGGSRGGGRRGGGNRVGGGEKKLGGGS